MPSLVLATRLIIGTVTLVSSKSLGLRNIKPSAGQWHNMYIIFFFIPTQSAVLPI